RALATRNGEQTAGGEGDDRSGSNWVLHVDLLPPPTLTDRGGYADDGACGLPRRRSGSLRGARGDRAPDRRLRRGVVELHLAALMLDAEAAPDRIQVRRDRRVLPLLVQLLEDRHADRLVALAQRALERPIGLVVAPPSEYAAT